MIDMLVDLLKLPDETQLISELEAQGVQIRRALVPDKRRVAAWVEEHSGLSAAGECDVSFARIPVGCFIATRGSRIIGYACYNATAPDYFGPTRVLEEERGKGIGKALLLRSLHALRDEGYIYAIIGGAGPQDFYKKCVGALPIPGGCPGIYKDFLARIEKQEKEGVEED